ncbi:hypothetical protein E4K10_18075 [Streptomyces sp. T1317-0309]|nr:hypothetical protein E4K10_18075 [Streptomyces sp. T1317-0309]
MTPADATELLALAAAFDRRTVGEADARAWAAALHAIPLDNDTREAVARHYSESSDWITPAHVRQQRQKIRNDRIATANVLDDGRPDETPAEFLARRRAALRAIGDGHMPAQTISQVLSHSGGHGPLALTGGPAPSVAKRMNAMRAAIHHAQNGTDQ